MKKSLLILSASLVLFACNNTSNASTESNAMNTSEMVAEESNQEATLDHSDWNTFFEDFKAMVIADDKANVLHMSHGMAYDELSDWAYDTYFSDEYRAYFNDFTPQDISEDNSIQLEDYAEHYEIAIHLKGEEEYEGEIYEYESAIFYVFAKVEGVYKLVSVLMAG